MKLNEINIRDPFILSENGRYYLYGTRAKSFGVKVMGADVYVSDDLETWSDPIPCLDSEKHGLNRGVNWAPEVHRYNGAYYMFITFTRENGLRGTCILRSESPEGPFVPHSDGAVTPYDWECLDGTLYIEDGRPYIVFCHEHTQITDGTVCYMPLSPDLKSAAGEAVTLFAGSEPFYIKQAPPDGHYVTDGPFMHRNADGTLLMIWSTFINGQYAECLVRFTSGTIKGPFEHLDPMIDDDGGHGMIFTAGDKLCLTFHSPNRSLYERPVIIEIEEEDGSLRIKK